MCGLFHFSAVTRAAPVGIAGGVTIPAPFLLRLLVRRVEPIAVGSPPIVF
jgi:hypothetical protein